LALFREWAHLENPVTSTELSRRRFRAKFSPDLDGFNAILYMQYGKGSGAGMSTQMIVRLDPGLKTKVNNLAKSEGKSVSEVVRELIEGYVRDRDISSYVDDLWERVGDKLTTRRVKPQDVQRTIRQVRARK
jgi:predicted DNA-binding protein